MARVRVGVVGIALALGLLVLSLGAAPSASATVLCKTATNPCTGGTYAKGTAVEASLKSGTKFSLTTSFGEIRCSESTIKGEVSTAGGKEADTSIAITSFSLGECNCGAKVVKNGSWSAGFTEAPNGKVTSTETETTFECLETHCIYETSSTSIGTLKGGEMASVAMEGTLPRVGGRSGATCGSSGTLKAEYTVTKPEPLYVEEQAISTVLCKTSTNPCTGGTYAKGTTVEARLKSTSTLHPVIGDVSCSESLIQGEVTSAGGEGANVSGLVSWLSFTGCNATVSVLKKGTFSIERTSEGDGTLKLEGLETTVEFSGFHCIFSGPVSFTLKGGEMASLSSPTALKRTTGRSGFFCGESATWTAEYTLTKPEPLYVEEP